LRTALAPYAGRWSVEAVAADTDDGEATFFTEPTGRYGGLQQTWKTESITVPTRSFTTMVDEVLAKEDRIDVMKVDVEGLEEKLVSALLPHQLDRIDTIFYETPKPVPLHTDRYAHSFSNQVNCLVAHASH
jgi:FkbM family methyltransferase